MKPSLPLDFENMVKKRHELLLTKYLVFKKKKIYKIGRYKIVVYPDVFPPFDDSIFFYRFLQKIKNPGAVLDMGTGSGVLALAIQKNAKSIIAAKINKKAVKSVKETLKINKIKNIEARYSNIFSNIREKFDIIVYNSPFMYFKPESLLEKAICDKNYKNLEKFLKQSKAHLNKKGKIFLEISNIGDITYIKRLIKKYKFKLKFQAKKKAFAMKGMKGLYYFILELK